LLSVDARVARKVRIADSAKAKLLPSPIPEDKHLRQRFEVAGLCSEKNTGAVSYVVYFFAGSVISDL
jgi:hypothetical protein